MTCYTDQNFKTKKALKDAVAARMAWEKAKREFSLLSIDAVMMHGLGYSEPARVTYYQPGPFGGNEVRNGTVYLQGPHYPEPHRWYAQGTAKDGALIAVK